MIDSGLNKNAWEDNTLKGDPTNILISTIPLGVRWSAKGVELLIENLTNFLSIFESYDFKNMVAEIPSHNAAISIMHPKPYSYARSKELNDLLGILSIQGRVLRSLHQHLGFLKVNKIKIVSQLSVAHKASHYGKIVDRFQKKLSNNLNNIYEALSLATKLIRFERSNIPHLIENIYEKVESTDENSFEKINIIHESLEEFFDMFENIIKKVNEFLVNISG